MYNKLYEDISVLNVDVFIVLNFVQYSLFFVIKDWKLEKKKINAFNWDGYKWIYNICLLKEEERELREPLARPDLTKDVKVCNNTNLI